MTQTRFSVLAIDGGGIRGVIPARVLQSIEERLKRPISDLFDVIAGTSTGGIIPLGLTKPDSPGSHHPAFAAAELVELYTSNGGEIFPNSLAWKIRSIDGLIDDRYPVGPLETLLMRKFGDTKLSEALREVVIPSYDLSGPAPFFFKRPMPAIRHTSGTWRCGAWRARPAGGRVGSDLRRAGRGRRRPRCRGQDSASGLSPSAGAAVLASCVREGHQLECDRPQGEDLPTG